MDARMVSDLLATTPALVAEEREAIARVIERLAELDRERTFVEAGYGSLFDYCRRKLLYSEGSANRRIRAARCLANDPMIGVKLRSGELSLCTLSTAATEIAKGTVALEEITGRSKREVEAIVAKVNPVLAVKRESVRPVAVVKTRVAPDTTPLFSMMVQPPPPDEDLYEVKFTLSRAEYEELMRARAKLSNTLGANNSVARVISTLVSKFLNPQTRKPPTATTNASSTQRSRYIPRSVKREIDERDEGRCQYVASDGTRCEERCYLHVDHVKPFALGGTATAGNTRLLCAAHNHHLAIEVFGSAKVPRRRGCRIRPSGTDSPLLSGASEQASISAGRLLQKANGNARTVVVVSSDGGV